MKQNQVIRKLGVITSGGDAPGMNAAIRSVVRTAIYNNLEVVGIMKGFAGILNSQFIELKSHSVSKTISNGGTMLKSSRCPEFKEAKAREIAYKNLKEKEIDALIVIGGDGSFKGASLLQQEFGLPVIGVPGTIDNDIFGTDYTIGFDTAINTAATAIDKIRDTADSHNIVFFVEVMGRHAGFIALHTSIACGAEAVLIPEVETDVKKLSKYLELDRRKEKTSGIVIVAEGAVEGGAAYVAKVVKEHLPNYDTRLTTLGHIQRGGSPTCNDRILASLLGHEAVNALIEGKNGAMVGVINNHLKLTPFEEVFKNKNQISKKMFEVDRILSL
ncbi:MAG: 6-phosphofructokinase [Bacteroidales bacterium]|nr:6-phosphofructokinase [Bacteroidales bacterium]